MLSQVLLFVLLLSPSFADESRRPHILMILADDMGWNDVGYHGSEVKTPNIDSLAATGIKLESYYVQPMCTPSRSALLTGRYPIHTGLQHEVIYAGQRAGLPLQIKTLANELKDIGYATHGMGKWHLGFYEEEYLPLQRGFDSWKGYLTGNEDYYNRSSCQSLGCGYDFLSNNNVDYADNDTYSTFVFTERAKQVITEHDPNQPLFLYIPYQAVHFPLQVPLSYLNQYGYIEDENRKIYAGMATCMDESIGNITRYLKEKGMWDDTILIFSTDNGGETSRGGSNWPLRGKKWTLWEGGIRGAAFIHSPLLELRKGFTYRSLMHISDWYPTILEGVLNQSLPVNQSLDGVNMWDSIIHDVAGPRTEILHNIDPLMPHPGDALYNDTFPTNTTAAIRVGDWKLLTGYPGVSDWFPVPTQLRRHYKWANKFTRTWASKLKDVLKTIFKDFDTRYHKADPTLNVTLDSYDPDRWENEDTLDIERRSDGSKKNVWLFNITADPEEIIDLSDSYPDVVLELLSRLAHYNSTAIPPNFPDIDPEAAPSHHNGTWVPWESQTSLVGRIFTDIASAFQSILFSIW